MKKASAAIFLLTFLAVTGGSSLAETVYSIQVAASAEKSSAQETSEHLNRMGHDSFVRLETIPGKGQWYRVYIERFGSKAQAEKEAAMLKSLGLLKECFVKELKEVADPKRSTPPTPQTRTKAISGTIEDSPKRAALAASVHFLHTASFKEKANAEKTVIHLQRNGQKAFFAEEGTGIHKWFRTYIGEFGDTTQAQKAGALLKEKGVITYYKVISFNKGEEPARNAALTPKAKGS